MSVHITNTHWDRHLCPQAFKHCPAFCASEKSHMWGLLAFAEFGMLIWCPGTVGVFLFHGDCFCKVYMGCPSSQPSLMSCILWGVAGELLTRQFIRASSFLGLGGSHQALLPSRLCFRVTLRPKQLPTNSPETFELAEGEQPGWCWLQRRWHEGARRLCVGSVTVWMCCYHIHKGCLIGVTLWNALIFTGSHKIVRVGGDFVVDKVLGEFLRSLIHQTGGDFYKALWLCCATQS